MNPYSYTSSPGFGGLTSLSCVYGPILAATDDYNTIQKRIEDEPPKDSVTPSAVLVTKEQNKSAPFQAGHGVAEEGEELDTKSSGSKRHDTDKEEEESFTEREVEHIKKTLQHPVKISSAKFEALVQQNDEKQDGQGQEKEKPMAQKRKNHNSHTTTAKKHKFSVIP